MAYIEIEGLKKTYKTGEIKNTVLNDVNLKIEEGELVVIYGPSGAGKTTLLNIIGGLDTADEGKIIIGNQEINKLSASQLNDFTKNNIGFVFQFYNLIQNLTALENVKMASELVRKHRDEIQILDELGIKDKKDKMPFELSGGEQQRVCIARAIVNEPKLLICDEPTGNLDPETSEEIMKVIENINKELGTTIIMATHDKDIVNRMKKRVLVINHGVLVGDYAKGSYKTNEGM